MSVAIGVVIGAVLGAAVALFVFSAWVASWFDR